jgi:UvrB/uvrC motif
MSQDIDAALQGWHFKPGVVQARLIQTGDGRQVIQMRVDLGVLQIETKDRPDGTRPNGFATYYDYLRHLARGAERAEQPFVLSEEQCLEADREFVQFYHRRICWLALRQFDRAVADADHTLVFMNFTRDHSPGEDYTQAHEQYRGFVIFQRTQAAALAADERGEAEGAIDEIRAGLERMREFFASYEVEEQMEEDGMVQQLRKMEKSLRKMHGIDKTLPEQLNEAVAREDYETAAKLRDQLRRRPGGERV